MKETDFRAKTDIRAQRDTGDGWDGRSRGTGRPLTGIVPAGPSPSKKKNHPLGARRLPMSRLDMGSEKA
jgi:hypothetical protein